MPAALNGFLYSCLRSTKSQRRTILMNLLKQFDDTACTSLTMRLYLAENLAYIPYTVAGEPLFLIHHIDIMVSVTGSNVLQSMTMFVENITTGQGCLLLLVLREHLKELYAINETKIAGYSPSEAQKIYERAVFRKTSAV